MNVPAKREINFAQWFQKRNGREENTEEAKKRLSGEHKTQMDIIVPQDELL